MNLRHFFTSDMAISIKTKSLRHARNIVKIKFKETLSFLRKLPLIWYHYPCPRLMTLEIKKVKSVTCILKRDIRCYYANSKISSLRYLIKREYLKEKKYSWAEAFQLRFYVRLEFSSISKSLSTAMEFYCTKQEILGVWLSKCIWKIKGSLEFLYLKYLTGTILLG